MIMMAVRLCRWDCIPEEVSVVHSYILYIPVYNIIHTGVCMFVIIINNYMYALFERPIS